MKSFVFMCLSSSIEVILARQVLHRPGDMPSATTRSAYCLDSNGLQISEDTLLYSNLGGYGASGNLSIPESMHFVNVLENVNMDVTAASSYFPGDRPNVIHGDMARVGLASGSGTTMHFAFRDDDGNLTSIPNFMFSMLGEAGPSKSAQVCGYVSFVLAPDTIVQVVTFDEGDRKCAHVSWPETQKNVESRHIRNLDANALKGTVSFLFAYVSNFDVDFQMDAAGRDGATSGSFLWGGQSNLVCGTLAPCSSYTCPKFFELSPNADNLYCVADICSDKDRNGCCVLSIPDTCQPDMTMLFAQGSLLYSNLAGKGPDFRSPEGMFYKDIFPGSMESMDMFVSSETPYTPVNNSWNGQYGTFGSVNIMSGTKTTLRFSFLQDGRSVKTPFPFQFSIMDFDVDRFKTSVEKVTVDNLTHYELTENTSIQVTTKDLGPRGNRTIFTATEKGNATDNPSDPLNLTAMQLNKAVTLDFNPLTDFRITFSVSKDSSQSLEGRNFMFAGWTETSCSSSVLCFAFPCPEGKTLRPEDEVIQCVGDACHAVDEERCCMDTPPPTCAWENTLSFSHRSLYINDLGSQGPEYGEAPIIFVGDVHPGSRQSGDLVDMIIMARSGYYPGNTSINQVAKGIVSINMVAGSTLDLRINLIDRQLKTETMLDTFYLSLLDIGCDGPGRSTESVTVHGVDMYSVTNDTSLDVSEDGATVTFTGQEKDLGPPMDPLRLTSEQRRRSVMAVFRHASIVDLELKTTAAADGSSQELNFFLTGRSNIACPSPRTCEGFRCPAATVLVAEPSTTSCKEEECTPQECCEPDMAPLCVLDKAMSFNNASVVVSNLGGLGPDIDAPETLVFNNVFPHRGESMTLKIIAVTDYSGDVSRNALAGLAGGISVDPGTNTTFTFEVVPGNDATVPSVMPFWITFQDIIRQSVRGRTSLRKAFSPRLRARNMTLRDLEKNRTHTGVSTMREQNWSLLRLRERHSTNKGRRVARGVRGLKNEPLPHPFGMKTRRPHRVTHAEKRQTHRKRMVEEALEGGRMWLSTSNAVDHYVSHPSAIAYSRKRAIRSFYAGNVAREDIDVGFAPNPMALGAFQKASSVALKFRTARFNITLGVEQGATGPKTFKFSGITNMMCAEASTCSSYKCPADYKARPNAHQDLCLGAVCTARDRDTCCELAVCAAAQELKLKPGSLRVSNLGGFGPDSDRHNRTEEALIYENVFPHWNQTVNLVVMSTTADYRPHNVSKNGLHGTTGSINLLAGSVAHLNFSFVSSETGQLVQVEPFAFSLLDIDQQHVDGQESVDVTDYSFMATSKYTDVETDESNTVTSKEYGNFPDNPTNLRMLTPEQLARAVTYHMNSVSSFQVTLKVSQGFAGRNFVFGGATNMMCPVRAHCRSFQCPDGYTPRLENMYEDCAGETCRNIVEDVSLCCTEGGEASAESPLRVFKDERRANGLDKSPLPVFRTYLPTPAVQAGWKVR